MKYNIKYYLNEYFRTVEDMGTFAVHNEKTDTWGQPLKKGMSKLPIGWK